MYNFDPRKRDLLDDSKTLFFEDPHLFQNGLIAMKK
jgi:hypothetical protein